MFLQGVGSQVLHGGSGLLISLANLWELIRLRAVLDTCLGPSWTSRSEIAKLAGNLNITNFQVLVIAKNGLYYGLKSMRRGGPIGV